ncbi:MULTISPECIES: hypothetical protein [unclassified Streptomyces]|nr:MULTISPECIES: hypothetical protein [unclassified Streptomyces]
MTGKTLPKGGHCLKAEIKRRWGTIDLIDILKGAAPPYRRQAVRK